ncbi:hypothetical protein X948_5663 [Burkholderia pseudomallei MSHR5608]|nr:hypothetical protein X948_5663 [Burkholderia pseudomallei MSHR5608]
MTPPPAVVDAAVAITRAERAATIGAPEYVNLIAGSDAVGPSSPPPHAASVAAVTTAMIAFFIFDLRFLLISMPRGRNITQKLQYSSTDIDVQRAGQSIRTAQPAAPHHPNRK